MRYEFIWNFIQNTYLFGILIWFILAVFMRKSNYAALFFGISGILYAVVVLFVTLIGRIEASEPQMELSFLWEYRRAFRGSRYFLNQILNNILLFMPLGWFCGIRAKRPAWYTAVVLGCLVSLGIECAQLVTRLGLFELDDILNNTIGTLLGYLLVCGICKIDNKTAQKTGF